MSVNTAHQNGGVLIYSGECILIYSDNVTVDWSGQDNPLFKGSKHGRIYLTTHRMIFNHKDAKDPMQSFSYPFITLSDVELEQPIFGANYIKGKVRAQPNGNWMGEAKFKLLFKHGGAIDFGQAMLKAAHMATRSANVHDPPPPYVAPDSQWYAAPPPAYAPPPQGYYGWLPPTQGAFPNQPPQNTIFMTDGPPPYPGVNVPGGAAGGGYGPPPQGGGGYGPPPQGGGGYGPPQYGGGGGFQQPPSQGGYPDQNGGYPPQQGGGYPPQQGGAGGGGGYPPQNGAYPPQSGGFPLQNGGGYPPQNAGYPPQNGAYPPQQGGYPAPSGYPQFQQGAAAGGFQDAKAAEAAQSAYYDPNRPQMAYVPPPSYYENPPSYQDATHKKDQ